jgi:hypothetical protein
MAVIPVAVKPAAVTEAIVTPSKERHPIEGTSPQRRLGLGLESMDTSLRWYDVGRWYDLGPLV